MMNFNGLNMHLGNLSRLSNAQTRSISAENFTGEKERAEWPPTARARGFQGLGRGLEGLSFRGDFTGRNVYDG